MPDQTLISTPFGFESTAADVIAGVDLTGKRAIVTGGAAGLGLETARALAGAGADVTIAVRDTAAAGERVAGTDVHVAPLDLIDQDSIAAFVAGWTGPLHILVNNAGVMGLPALQLTPEGWETQLATNFLGHFALARGLHGALAAAGGARVVSVSSAAHLQSPVVFDDLHFAHRPYDPGLAYAQSKTADALFAVEAARRWHADGIAVNALDPGTIATDLFRHHDPALIEQVRNSGVYRFKTIEQGAATSVLLAASPLVEGVSGRYFQNANEIAVGEQLAAYAVDPAQGERLWELAERLVG